MNGFYMAPTTSTQETQQNLMFPSNYYAASGNWAIKTVSAAADRYTLVSPATGAIKINGSKYGWESVQSLVLSLEATWDTVAGTDYRTALNRRGVNFHVYACEPTSGLVPTFKVSSNASAPDGYTTSNSVWVAGFHGLCCGVGTISGHALTGYVSGDILPSSVKDIYHRPFSDAGGLAYDPYTDWWYGIYFPSGTGASTASAWNATISATRSWFNFREDLWAVKQTFILDNQFTSAAYKSNEGTVLYGVAAVTTTGKMSSSTYTGAGLNDLSFSRAAWYHANENQEYEIEVDLAAATDTFKYRQRNFAGTWGAYTASVAMTGAAQAIGADGLTVTFNATTGHTLGNKWNVRCMEAGFDSAGRRMISNIGLESCCGHMQQWLGDAMFSFGSPASHTHSVTVTGDPQTVSTGVASADISPAAVSMDPGLSRGTLAVQASVGYCKIIAGGSYGSGAASGSMSRSTNSYATITNAAITARGSSPPRRYA